jgi:hypothetical protein
VFIEPNGCMFADYKDETCFCGHKNSRHLDKYSICLATNPTCISDGFKNESTQRPKVRNEGKNNDNKIETDIQQDPVINNKISYLQTISKM